MRIERLELRLLKLPLVHFFETSFGRIHDKHFLLVRLDDGSLIMAASSVPNDTDADVARQAADALKTLSIR